MLSSGGLGYFEYEATVEGDATLKLTVSLEQVDDVLKSLVVYDDKGGVGGLSLPGSEPLAQAFKDLPFDQDSLDSPADLLSTLKGAQVIGRRQRAPSRAASSRSGGDRQTLDDGKATTKRTRVTLLTDRGLQQFILEDAENLQFADAALRDKVGQALLAIQTNRAKDARTLELATRGQGQRTVRVAYIVEVPVWKASYRLTLAADPAAARLGPAGLGDGRESERPGLEGRRADAGLGPSGRLPPGALRRLLRQAAGSAGRGRGPADARHRPRRRARPSERGGGAAAAAAARTGAYRPQQERSTTAATMRRRRTAGRPPTSSRPPTRQRRSMFKFPQPGERRQRPHALDPDHRPPGAGAAAGALSGRDGGAQSAGGDPAHQRRRHRPAARHPDDLRARQGGHTSPMSATRGCRPSRSARQRLLAYALDEKITVERDAAQTDRIATGTIAQGALRYQPRHPPDHDLSRARPGQGAAAAGRRAAPAAGLDAGQARRQGHRAERGQLPHPVPAAGRRPDPDLRGRAGADPAAGAAPGRQRGRPDPGLRPGARVRRQDARGADQDPAAPAGASARPSAR